MVKIGPLGPKVNTLNIFENMTYANTAIETWQIIRFFLNEMRPVSAVDPEPEDVDCPICGDEFTTDLYRAVRLPCDHTFGEPCIKRWVNPHERCTPNVSRAQGTQVGVNQCLLCRHVLVPQQTTGDMLPTMEARIRVWDETYKKPGIELSETEHQARDDL